MIRCPGTIGSTMRRADRLFEIVQILRRAKGPTTAAAIAEELETSRRSVYRDVAALLQNRVPICGEAGVGYVLEPGFDMPPLMLTLEEITAASLGAQWIAAHADPTLARAARDLAAKIRAVVPSRLRASLDESVVVVQPSFRRRATTIDLSRVREWCNDGRMMTLEYRDGEERTTTRTIRPFAVAYREAGPVIVAWCESREAFRFFRVDRIERATFGAMRYAGTPSSLRRAWRREMRERDGIAITDGCAEPSAVEPIASLIHLDVCSGDDISSLYVRPPSRSNRKRSVT